MATVKVMVAINNSSWHISVYLTGQGLIVAVYQIIWTFRMVSDYIDADMNIFCFTSSTIDFLEIKI